MSAPVEMSQFAARVSRPPFWPAPTNGGDWTNPPQLPGAPCADEQRDTEIVGRLRALLGQIAADADYYQVPADLLDLIGQAQRIAGGDLPQWQQGRAAA